MNSKLLSPFGKEFFSFPSDLKNEIREHPLVIIREQELNDQELIKLAASLSEKNGSLKEKVLHWDFGPVMTMKFDPQAENYLFSAESVPFHWDGAFYEEPQYLLFYCTESNGCGGETLFSHSTFLYHDIHSLYPNHTLTYQTEKKAHYGGQFSTLLYRDHPFHGEKIVRFAEKVETERNPVSLSIDGSEEQANTLYNDLSNRLYQSRYCYEHRWRKGDLLIADNFTLLHGRKALLANTSRSFKRLQILS